jgi:glycosyltransferase involved in cell wall biosynthesis
MNIWTFNHYAESPAGAATRTFDLSRGLVRRGHRVTIFACSYSHYRLREEHFTEAIGVVKAEEKQGVCFVWLRGVPYRSNDWRRIANFVVYGVEGLVSAIGRRPKPDVVIGSSVHPIAGLSALAVARLLQRPFFLEVPDIWPQVLIEFGRIQPNSLLARSLEWIERLLAHAANRILVLWRDADEYGRRLGLEAQKLVWMPHVIDARLYEGIATYADHPPPFTVMYLGSLVESMALDTVLEAARILQANGRTHIRLVLVGGGSERARLARLIDDYALANVELREPVPKTNVPNVLATADCFLCSTKKLPVYRYGLSMSKTYEYMMAARPILFAVESTYNPVAEAEAGISVAAEDPAALAAAIERVIGLPFTEREAMGRRGRDWVVRHHDVDAIVERFEKVLLEGAALDEAAS